MNKYILTIMLMLCGTALIAQTNDTVYTPNHTPVPVEIREESLSEETIEYYSIYFENTYPRADEVDSLSSTSKYNCHGYAWHMYPDSLYDKVYMSGNDENNYWNDSSYTEVPRGFAQKVSYTSPLHSAIVISDTMCRSKFGNNVLADHPIDYLPIFDDTLGSATWKYYARTMEINGNGTLYSSVWDYTITNANTQSNMDFEWIPGPNFEVAEGQGTSRCNFNLLYRFPGEDDSSYIDVRLISNGDTLWLHKDIELGPPTLPSISGPEVLCSSGENYTISEVPDGCTINWFCGWGVQRVGGDDANPCEFRASGGGGAESTIWAQITKNGETVTLDPDTVELRNTGTPTVIPSGNVTTVMSGYYYTVPRNTYNVFFQMDPGGTYVDPAYDTWSYSGDNPMYVYGRFLDMTTYNIGINDVIGSQSNSCAGSPSYVYFTVEVVSAKSGDGGDELSFTLSPNPAKEYVDIDVRFPDEKDVPGKYRVDFVDAYSRNVKQVELSGTFNRVDVQDIKKGYYVVMLRYDGEVYSNRLIVE